MIRFRRRFSGRWLESQKLETALSIILIIVPIWWIGWPYWGETLAAGAALEEQALTSVSANNIKAGFFRNWGIADYGLNGPDLPLDKMFYTHFPSGPDVILAVLRTLNFSEPTIRQIYILIAFSSVPILCSLLNKLRFRPATIGLLTSFYLFNYRGFWAYTDHFVYAFYFPLLFLGVIGLFKIFRKEKYAYLFFITFLAASYITSFLGFFTLVTAAITMSFFLKQDQKKILLASLLSAITLIFLHLLRNTLVLGWGVASQDLFYTLGNRMFGNPSKLAVMDFFRKNKIAWWGTNNSSLRNLLEIFRSTLFVHIGLIISLTAIISRKLLPFSFGKSKRAIRRELEDFDVLGIITASSFVWYVLFPHQGKNYYFPPIFHTAALFAIIACTQFIINELTSPKFDGKVRSLIKTAGTLTLLLIVIPAVSAVSWSASTLLDISLNKTILVFALFSLFILIIQAIPRNFSVGKTIFITLAGLYSFSTIFLIQLIAISLSLESLSLNSKILFALGLFFAISYTFKFFSDTNFGNLRPHVATSLLISIIFVNCFTLFQANLSDAREARSSEFQSSEVEAFNDLPKLNGNIWTNLNAPLLFRYTGGLVNGYCQATGLLEKNKEYCSSGRVSDLIDEDLPSYVVLSEIYPSGDSACLYLNPCFEEVKSKLALSHIKINSPTGFYIFEQKLGE